MGLHKVLDGITGKYHDMCFAEEEPGNAESTHITLGENNINPFVLWSYQHLTWNVVCCIVSYVIMLCTESVKGFELRALVLNCN